MKNKLVASSIALAICSTFSLADDVDNNTVVVTANRIEQNINDTLSDVVIIERVDIDRIQPQSLIDLLVNVAGVDFVQKGGHGQDASVFVRGANSGQLLVLVDGVRVGSATLGSKSISGIALGQIEKIELVKGPRAAIWGSDAIGGVLQIFTRQFNNGDARISNTLGSNKTYEIDAAVGFGNETLSNTLSYHHKRSDGFDVLIKEQADDDGYESDSLAIRGNYKINANNLIDWLAQSDRGENEFDTTYGGDITYYRNQLSHFRYLHQTKRWDFQAAYGSSRDRSYSFPNDIKSVFETRRQQVNLLARHQLSDSLAMVSGIDWYQDDIGLSTTEYDETERDTKSAHVSLNYITKQWIADVAIRHDDVEKIASETTFNLGAGYRFSQAHLLSLNYGEGFKAPTFNDLYYPFGGNSELTFETSDNLELIYKGVYESSNFTVSIYQSNIKNLIQWAPDNTNTWTPQNIGQVDINGIDLAYRLNRGEYSHQFTASRVNTEDAETNEQLIRRAKNRIGYQLIFTGEKLDWFTQLEYVGKRSDSDFQTYAPINLDSYVRVNMGVGYMVEDDWKIQLKINDAFDEAPTLVSGYYPIEREVYLTVSYHNF